MMLFILKGFTKPLNKFSTEQIYFERFFTLLPILLFYSATYLKYWLTNIGQLGNCKKRRLEKSKLSVVQVKYFDHINGDGVDVNFAEGIFMHAKSCHNTF